MTIIVAIDKNRGIGYKGNLLCKIPDDMRRFKTLTLGNTVVMGRKTMESLPGAAPLSGRKNLVLTSRRDIADGFSTCRCKEDLLALLPDCPGEIFVIGGESVYRLMLPYCDRAYVTEIDESFDADSFFPALAPEDGWQVSESSAFYEYNGVKYRFLTYKKTG